MNEEGAARFEPPTGWICTPEAVEGEGPSGVGHGGFRVLRDSLASGWEVLKGRADTGPTASSAGPSKQVGV